MTTPKCSTCRDTGHRDPSSFDLDCTDCSVAIHRAALNDFVKYAPRKSLYQADLHWAIHQRALAMAPKQEAPVSTADERAAFEAAARRITFSDDSSFEREGDDYADYTQSRHWAFWQARADLVAVPAVANGAPELPRAEFMTDMHIDGRGKAAYSADQMRAYGQSCAAAGPDAALMSQEDALNAALQRAAGELPDGYTIRVEVEQGAGWVEWSGGDAEGTVDHQDSIAGDVLQALADAKEHAAAAGVTT